MDALSALYSLVYEFAVCRDTIRSDDVAGQWTQAPSYFSDVSFLSFSPSVFAAIFMSLILFGAG